MKKTCSILLIIALASTLAACGGGSRSSSATSPSGGYLTGSRASSAPETASESPADAAATELTAEENWALIADYFRANFPQPLMTVRADVNRDGLDDCVFVDTLTDEWARFGYVLTVKNGEVQKYLVKEGGETHGQGFFDWFLSPNEQGDAYLIEYNTSMWQGIGTLTMLRYYLDENGEKVILDEYTVGDKPEDNDEKGVIKDSIFKEFYVEGAKWLHRKYILHIAGTWGNGNWSDLEMLDPQIPAIAFADEDEESEEERRNITGNGIIDVYFTDTDHPVKMIDGAYEILLPKSWSGRYVANIEKTPGTQEETVDFFCKACYDTDPRSGWLCSVYFANFVEVTANDAASPGSEWRQLGEWSGGDVYLLLPTDVPVTSKDPALQQEYAAMAGEVKNIIYNEAS